jgi:UDP-glucose 4-epimerase
MKVIVTGAAGFIGSNIVDELILQGHHVIAIDNESAECHQQFYWNVQAENYKYDITDYNLIRPLFEGVDYVFHLAAEARIQPSLINPILTIKTNALGTTTILQCAKEASVKRVIYSSTSSAYGRKHYSKEIEEYCKTNGFIWAGLSEYMEDDCLTPYSISKTNGEKMCKLYSTLFGLDTITLRYFNVYGLREPTKGQYAPVIGLFLRQHFSNHPLTIVGDGEQRRDFTNIKDVVRANIMCMNHPTSLNGEIFNIGTSRNYSINEIAKMISPNNTVRIPERKGESRVTLANCIKAKSVLGWEATVKLEDYISEQLKTRENQYNHSIGRPLVEEALHN